MEPAEVAEGGDRPRALLVVHGTRDRALEVRLGSGEVVELRCDVAGLDQQVSGVWCPRQFGCCEVLSVARAPLRASRADEPGRRAGAQRAVGCRERTLQCLRRGVVIASLIFESSELDQQHRVCVLVCGGSGELTRLRVVEPGAQV